VFTVASAPLDENDGFVQLPPAGAALPVVVVVVVLGAVVVVLGAVVVVLGAVVVGAVFLEAAVAVVVVDRAEEVVVVAWSVVVVVVGLAALLCPCSLPAGERSDGADPPPDTAMAIPPPTAASTRPVMTIRRTVPLRHVIGEGLSLAIGNVTSLRGRKGLGLAHAEFVRLRFSRVDRCIKCSRPRSLNWDE
jgi:hypothetical protein